MSIQYLKGNQNDKKPKITRKKQLLAYAQHGERTRPPTMIIEGKRSKFRLQRHKRKLLNLVNHLHNRALLVVENPIVSFFSNFPNGSKPDSLKNRAPHLRSTNDKTELIKMIGHLTRCDRRNA